MSDAQHCSGFRDNQWRVEIAHDPNPEQIDELLMDAAPAPGARRRE
jgi:hypothetical protein